MVDDADAGGSVERGLAGGCFWEVVCQVNGSAEDDQLTCFRRTSARVWRSITRLGKLVSGDYTKTIYHFSCNMT